MVFHQAIATFLAILEAIGLPGNLMVIVVITLETRFHVMRYIFLASLAVSDLLFLILVNSFRIASIAQERWLYGETMCYLNHCFLRYFYFNTVLHLLAVSYERYCAIVKSPLTYDGTITKSKVAFITLIWIIPIPLAISPFLGSWGNYVYNPKLFFCEQRWSVQISSASVRLVSFLFASSSSVVPFVVVIFLNWSVNKTTRSQINAVQVQLGSFTGSESQQQVMETRRREYKAAADVSIVIAAFLACYLPAWIVVICRQFVEIPANAILLVNAIFFLSSVLNPIIYSFRKREFRNAVYTRWRWLKLCGSPNYPQNNTIPTDNSRFGATLGTKATGVATPNSS